MIESAQQQWWLSLLAGFTIFVSSIWAQPLQVQIYTGVAWYQHRLELAQLPMFSKPPAAEPFRFDKIQPTWFGGIGLSYRLTRALTVGGAVEYSNWSAQLEASERIPAIRSGDSIVSGVIAHRVQLAIAPLGISPMVTWHIDNVALTGGCFLYWFPRRSFQYWEEIQSPAEATFLDGTRQQLRAEGILSPIRQPLLMSWVQVAATFGKIASTLGVSAFLRYQRSIGTVLPDSNWHVQTFSLGVELSGDLLGAPPRHELFRDTVYQRDTTTTYDVMIAADTVLLQAETARTEHYAIGDLTIALTIVHQTYIRKVPMPHSLLTATIVPKLVTRDGREDTVLSIKGTPGIEHRFDFPLSAVVIADTAVPPLVAQLCQQQWQWFFRTTRRTASVRWLLQRLLPSDTLTLFGIAAASRAPRFAQQLQWLASFLSRCLPCVVIPEIETAGAPSQPSIAFPHSSSNIFLLMPHRDSLLLRSEQDTVLISNIRKVRFYLRAVAEAGVKRWSIVITAGEQKWIFRGFSDPPSFIDWNLAGFPVWWKTAAAPVHFFFQIEDFDGQVFRTPTGSITVRVLPSDSAGVLQQRRYRFAFYPVRFHSALWQQIRSIMSAKLEALGGLQHAYVVAPGRQIPSTTVAAFEGLPVPLEGYYPVPAGQMLFERWIANPIWVFVER